MPGKPRRSYLEFQIEQKSPEELKHLSEKIDNRLFGEMKEDPKAIELIAVGEVIDDAKEYIDNWGKTVGISTGIKAVDYNLRGLSPGQLTVIAGETAHGKTALGVNIAVQVALQGIAVLFVTLEITHAEFTARVMKIVGSEETTLRLPLLMQKADELDWRDVDRLMEAAKDEGVGLVIIDHLHFFTREVERVAEDLGRITKQFKKNARQHNLPVILISHVRKKDNSSKPELTNDALRGSSYIAQDADVVMFVHKVSDNRVMVKTTKNRRGYNFDNDTVELDFIDGAILKDPPNIFYDPFEDHK